MKYMLLPYIPRLDYRFLPAALTVIARHNSQCGRSVYVMTDVTIPRHIIGDKGWERGDGVAQCHNDIRLIYCIVSLVTTCIALKTVDFFLIHLEAVHLWYSDWKVCQQSVTRLCREVYVCCFYFEPTVNYIP